MGRILSLLLLASFVSALEQDPLVSEATSALAGNPVFPGWYADPEARIFNDQYWIYPTYSAAYEEQTFFDAFSSPDLLTWTKHPAILNFSGIPWSTNRAAWAPSVARRRRPGPANSITGSGIADTDAEYDYFMYFSAGDGAGIGVAKSTTGLPEGPFVDAIGKPLVPETVFGAEAIDAQLFQDDADGDNRIWLYYGGWSHAIVVEMNEDMVSLKGEYLEITPEGVGGWGDNSYGVSYVTGPSPTGPFSSTPTQILRGNDQVGTGTGHNSVFTPDGEEYYIVYHRRVAYAYAPNTTPNSGVSAKSTKGY
ncbi:hypothetical protein AN1870.2 [Aspergillus nidulans FGSC A4]|nr:hypothetical protein AN1870.2 [Aspergillus nidulans FGSC A4]|eukprot:XP_659474.1 hypothetical protein AN1870.2 [Aspergillus nidulans FGSC A4]